MAVSADISAWRIVRCVDSPHHMVPREYVVDTGLPRRTAEVQAAALNRTVTNPFTTYEARVDIYA